MGTNPRRQVEKTRTLKRDLAHRIHKQETHHHKREFVCFSPTGLCRRGASCPYRHEGPVVETVSTVAVSSSTTQAKRANPAPKASTPSKAMVALIAANHALGTSASIAAAGSQQQTYEVSWALDSGAGEALASIGFSSIWGYHRMW